ncbi:MAG: hypothetical protein M0R80_00585 [Proteobacteria bacterium]|jgi:DNA-binding FrmR family transcriptional regulator|nr:hypothetical protein [Pseudomonadota bacterium]
MDFAEIQEQIKKINEQLAGIVKRVEDRTEINAIQDRLSKVEKAAQQAKQDQTAARVMAALRRDQG